MINDLASDADTVFAVATSSAFQRDGVCFVARRSGLLCSTDGGATWHPALPNESRPLIATAVSVHPDPATGPLVVAGVVGGTLISRDGGESWRGIALPPPAPIVSTIVSAADGVVLAGTFEDGILRSADGGMTWSPANAGLLDHCVLTLAESPGFTMDRTLLAGTASGLAISRNAGRSWTDTGFPDHPGPVTHVTIRAGEGGRDSYVAATESAGLWRSDDSGSTWRALMLPEAAGEVAALYRIGADLVVVGERAAFVSDDSRQGWKRLCELDGGDATIVTAAPVDNADPNAGFLVGMSDGSIRRLG